MQKQSKYVRVRLKTLPLIGCILVHYKCLLHDIEVGLWVGLDQWSEEQAGLGVKKPQTI
jgi:hypothetical protein